jgi:hypothetical protein
MGPQISFLFARLFRAAYLTRFTFWNISSEKVLGSDSFLTASYERNTTYVMQRRIQELFVDKLKAWAENMLWPILG